MPFSTNWEDRGVVWVFAGDVTAEEIERANAEFYEDPRSDQARYQIIDARAVTSVEWNDMDIKTTAAMDIGAEQVVKNVKVAYIASDPGVMDLLEQYADISRLLNSSWKFKGCETMAEARAWIAGS